MKTLNVNLFLPDNIHSTIIERAKAEGIEAAHYCSGLIVESIGSNIVKIPNGSSFVKADSSHTQANETHSNLPDTLTQIFAVCCCVWCDKLEFADAVHKVARNFHVNETTIRDKCTRRISLPHSPIDTEKFLNMLGQPPTLRDYLCHRFPKYSGQIVQRFEQILP